MRVHLICKRFYTNKDLLKDCFGRLYHLPLELAHRGVSVDVAAIDYRNLNSEVINMTGIVFRSIPASLSMLLFLPFLLYRNALAAKPDIIIASGDSHIGFIAMLIAKKLGVPFVFDVYDYYPAFSGNAIPGMKTMFRLSVKVAKLILCTSDPLLKKLTPLNGNGLLIENGVDQTIFAPTDMAHSRVGLGLDPKSVYVGYFGSIDPVRGPLLIEACRILRDEFPMLHLLLAGHVSRVDLSDPWITYLGEVTQAEVPRMINACNLVSVPYANNLFNDMCGACKIAEYLACGKPVVATRVSGHEQIFKNAPSSLCEPNPKALAEAIRAQLLDPQIALFPHSMSWEYIGQTLYESLQNISYYPSTKGHC
jgi:glycosyltransferase involved in cell wall biosynthesis